MAEKVDIFDALKRLDNFDIAYFDGLSDEQKKGLSPYILMEWMAGCKSPVQLNLLNSLVNPMVFELPSGHTNLLYKLLLAANDGKKTKYKWVKKKAKSKKYATCVDVIKRRFNCSTEIALGYVRLLDYDTIAEYAMELGEQDDTLKKIKKEIA